MEDPRLSWKARGLLAYLLTKPDNWQVHVAQLVGDGPDGTHSVRLGLIELEQAGYITRHKNRSVGGSFNGWEVEVHETPKDRSAKIEPRTEVRKSHSGSDQGEPLTEMRLSEVGKSHTKEPCSLKKDQKPERKRAPEDPILKAKAHRLTKIAMEQPSKPIGENGFLRALAVVKAALKAGESEETLEAVIRSGRVVWSNGGMETALARLKRSAPPKPKNFDYFGHEIVG